MDDLSRSLRDKGFVQRPDGQWYKAERPQRSLSTVDAVAVAIHDAANLAGHKPGNHIITSDPMYDRTLPDGMVVKKSTDVENLNKLETAWYEIMKRRGFVWLGVQNITIKLADRCRYTPDFSAVTQEGRFHFYETKGFMRDDANVKIKTAARLFPWAKFILVTRIEGEWNEKEINT